MKDNRGEISIMFVVMAIIFIVLGGICIFMLTGENGLFVPRTDGQVEETSNNTVNTNEVQEENITSNQNEVLTVPTE